MPDPTIRVLGMEVPDAGPVFLTVLAMHVLAGIVSPWFRRVVHEFESSSAALGVKREVPFTCSR